MLFPAEIHELSSTLLDACGGAGLRVATAESCTGGLIAAAITEIPGSSKAFVRGYVTYADEAKTAVLGVPEALLARAGAVSEEVARAMAEGALAAGDADIAVSATGVAGPGGGTAAKPVGLVHIAAARGGHATLHERHVFPGGRDAIRVSSVAAALRLALRQVR